MAASFAYVEPVMGLREEKCLRDPSELQVELQREQKSYEK